MSALTPSALDLIRTHVPCLGCGYDLYASQRNGLCPECGREVAYSISGFDLQIDPAKAYAARRMGAALLTSSIFAGLCPASCLLMLQTERFLGAIAMSVAFTICAVFAARGEAFRRQWRGHSIGNIRIGAPLGADVVATVGLLLVNLAAYWYAFQQFVQYEYGYNRSYEVAGMSLVGVGFFLLNLTAWRALPTWRAHAEVAHLLNARKTRGLLTFLAWTKAIYESLWLLCCWSPFALGMAGHSAEELAISLAFAALFGLFGFGVVWVLMIIAHAILLVQIRRATSIIPASD